MAVLASKAFGGGDMTFLQGRIVAETPDEAASAVLTKLEREGYAVQDLRLWAVEPQPWEGRTWFEYIATVFERRGQHDA